MSEFSLILGAVALFILPFSYSYWLGRKLNIYLRLLPVYLALVPIIAAGWTLMQPAGGFLDFRFLAALIYGIIALLILAGMGAGTFLRCWQDKKKIKKL